MKPNKSNDETFLQLTNIANNFKSTEENYLLSYPFFKLLPKFRIYQFREFGYRNKFYLFLDAHDPKRAKS